MAKGPQIPMPLTGLNQTLHITEQGRYFSTRPYDLNPDCSQLAGDASSSESVALRDALEATIVREASFSEFRAALTQYRMQLH